MFEGYQRQLSSEERMEFVGKAFRIEAAPHLSDSWHNSDDHEKTVLTAIALLEREGRGADRNFRVSDLQRLYTRSEETVGRLEKRGLVISEADHSALFNSSFGAWIIRELSAALREEQSYEEWLIGNKDMKERLSGTVQKELGEILPKIGAKYRDMVVTWAS